MANLRILTGWSWAAQDYVLSTADMTGFQSHAPRGSYGIKFAQYQPAWMILTRYFSQIPSTKSEKSDLILLQPWLQTMGERRCGVDSPTASDTATEEGKKKALCVVWYPWLARCRSTQPASPVSPRTQEVGAIAWEVKETQWVPGSRWLRDS